MAGSATPYEPSMTGGEESTGDRLDEGEVVTGPQDKHTEGDRVQVQFGRRWHKGTVVRARECGLYHIKFDDGDEEDDIGAHALGVV